MVIAMTHEDAGHYASKHSPSATLDEPIAEVVRQRSSDDKLTCAACHKIASDLNVLPSEVGRAIDMMEIRITKCQMGLFGYSPRKSIVEPAEKVMPALEDAIRASLVENRLTCAAAWGIADKLGIKKMDVSSACETLEIKISTCQLGSFK